MAETVEVAKVWDGDDKKNAAIPFTLAVQREEDGLATATWDGLATKPPMPPQKHPLPPGLCFWMGHMAHIIIFFQALVHACNAAEGGKEDKDDDEYAEDEGERGEKLQEVRRSKNATNDDEALSDRNGFDDALSRPMAAAAQSKKQKA